MPATTSRPADIVLCKKSLSPETASAKRPLCFEGGDFIVALTNSPNEHLVLHSSVIRQASIFFEGSLKDIWYGNAPTITHPTTGSSIKVYTQHVIFDQDNHVFTLGKKAGEIEFGTWRHHAKHMHLSSLANGYLPRRRGLRSHKSEHAEEAAIREYKALFGLLYRDDTFIDNLSYNNLANVAALAEMYNMLDVVALQLRNHLLRREGLWEDVRDFHRFHLALAIKLRCTEVYCDALRHVIGSGSVLTVLQNSLDFDYERLFSFTQKRDALRRKTDHLTEQLQALTLASYIPHAKYESKHGPDPEVKTTYLMSKHPTDFGSIADKCQDVARRIYMEWFNLQLCGQEHWTHVRQFTDTEHRDGMHYKSSLRNACNLAVEALQHDKPLQIFDRDAARVLTEHFFTNVEDRAYGQNMVEDTLRVFVSRMAILAYPLIAPRNTQPTLACQDHIVVAYDRSTREDRAPNDDLQTPEETEEGLRDFMERHAPARFRGRARHRQARPSAPDDRTKYNRSMKIDGRPVGIPESAMNDDNCHYFTCVDVDPKEDIPWEKDFEEWEVTGVESASREWLVAIELEVEVEMDEKDV